MKKYIILLLLTGCAGGLSLAKTWCDTEKARIDAYYDFRAHGGAFSSIFYQASDSIVKSASKGNKPLLTVLYKTISDARTGDSTNIYHLSYYKHIQDMLDAGFNIAKGVAK